LRRRVFGSLARPARGGLERVQQQQTDEQAGCGEGQQPSGFPFWSGDHGCRHDLIRTLQRSAAGARARPPHGCGDWDVVAW